MSIKTNSRNRKANKARQNKKTRYSRQKVMYANKGVQGVSGIDGGDNKKNKGVQGIKTGPIGAKQAKKPSITEDGVEFKWIDHSFTDNKSGKQFSSGYAAEIISGGGFVGYESLDEHRARKSAQQNKQQEPSREERKKARQRELRKYTGSLETVDKKWQADTMIPSNAQVDRLTHIKGVLKNEWGKVFKRVSDLQKKGDIEGVKRVLTYAGNKYLRICQEAYEHWGDGEAFSILNKYDLDKGGAEGFKDFLQKHLNSVYQKAKAPKVEKQEEVVEEEEQTTDDAPDVAKDFSDLNVQSDAKGYDVGDKQFSVDAPVLDDFNKDVLKKEESKTEEKRVGSVPIGELKLDPERFQFKHDSKNDKGYNAARFQGAKFNPDLAGTILVWRDPEDGELYVVNGHHRYNMAKNSGYDGDISVQFSNAKTAQEAKQHGAIQNIADGKGTGADVASLVRDGLTKEKMLQEGVAPASSIMNRGLVLANLSPRLFKELENQQNLDEDTALVIAENLPNDEDRQIQLYERFLRKFYENGEEPKKDYVEALATSFNSVEGQSKGANLFGEEDVDYIKEVETRAKIIQEILGTLRKDKRVFGRINKKNSDALAEKDVLKGTLDADAAKGIKEVADKTIATIKEESKFKGPLNDILKESVKQYLSAHSDGERNEIIGRAVDKLKDYSAGLGRFTAGQEDSGGDDGVLEERQGESNGKLVSEDAPRLFEESAESEGRLDSVSAGNGETVSGEQEEGNGSGRGLLAGGDTPGDEDGSGTRSGREEGSVDAPVLEETAEESSDFLSEEEYDKLSVEARRQAIKEALEKTLATKGSIDNPDEWLVEEQRKTIERLIKNIENGQFSTEGSSKSLLRRAQKAHDDYLKYLNTPTEEHEDRRIPYLPDDDRLIEAMNAEQDSTDSSSNNWKDDPWRRFTRKFSKKDREELLEKANSHLETLFDKFLPGISDEKKQHIQREDLFLRQYNAQDLRNSVAAIGRLTRYIIKAKELTDGARQLLESDDITNKERKRLQDGLDDFNKGVFIYPNGGTWKKDDSNDRLAGTIRLIKNRIETNPDADKDDLPPADNSPLVDESWLLTLDGKENAEQPADAPIVEETASEEVAEEPKNDGGPLPILSLADFDKLSPEERLEHTERLFNEIQRIQDSNNPALSEEDIEKYNEKFEKWRDVIKGATPFERKMFRPTSMLLELNSLYKSLTPKDEEQQQEEVSEEATPDAPVIGQPEEENAEETSAEESFGNSEQLTNEETDNGQEAPKNPLTPSKNEDIERFVQREDAIWSTNWYNDKEAGEVLYRENQKLGDDIDNFYNSLSPEKQKAFFKEALDYAISSLEETIKTNPNLSDENNLANLKDERKKVDWILSHPEDYNILPKLNAFIGYASIARSSARKAQEESVGQPAPEDAPVVSEEVSKETVEEPTQEAPVVPEEPQTAQEAPETPQDAPVVEEPSIEPETAENATESEIEPSTEEEDEDEEEAIRQKREYPHQKGAYYPVSEEAARRALNAYSFRDYKPGSETSSYRSEVDKARKIAEEQKKRVDPMYHDKIDYLLDKYERKLAQNYDAINNNDAKVPSVMISGAGNFPVRRKMKQNARRDTLYHERNEIDNLLQKIMGVGTAGVSSDDPNAVEKLQKKYDDLKKQHDVAVKVNKYLRKNGSLEGFEPADEEEKAFVDYYNKRYSNLYARSPGFHGVPQFALSNQTAEMRRIQERIDALKRNQRLDYGDGWTFDGGTVKANKEDNRLQIHFDDIPDAETRSKLKRNGFRWSPKNKVWQRQLTRDALSSAHLLGYIPENYMPVDTEKQQKINESPYAEQFKEALGKKEGMSNKAGNAWQVAKSGKLKTFQSAIDHDPVSQQLLIEYAKTSGGTGSWITFHRLMNMRYNQYKKDPTCIDEQKPLVNVKNPDKTPTMEKIAELFQKMEAIDTKDKDKPDFAFTQKGEEAPEGYESLDKPAEEPTPTDDAPTIEETAEEVTGVEEPQEKPQGITADDVSEYFGRVEEREEPIESDDAPVIQGEPQATNSAVEEALKLRDSEHHALSEETANKILAIADGEFKRGGVSRLKEFMSGMGLDPIGDNADALRKQLKSHLGNIRLSRFKMNTDLSKSKYLGSLGEDEPTLDETIGANNDEGAEISNEGIDIEDEGLEIGDDAPTIENKTEPVAQDDITMEPQLFGDERKRYEELKANKEPKPEPTDDAPVIEEEAGSKPLLSEDEENVLQKSIESRVNGDLNPFGYNSRYNNTSIKDLLENKEEARDSYEKIKRLYGENQEAERKLEELRKESRRLRENGEYEGRVSHEIDKLEKEIRDRTFKENGEIRNFARIAHEDAVSIDKAKNSFEEKKQYDNFVKHIKKKKNRVVDKKDIEDAARAISVSMTTPYAWESEDLLHSNYYQEAIKNRDLNFDEEVRGMYANPDMQVDSDYFNDDDTYYNGYEVNARSVYDGENEVARSKFYIYANKYKDGISVGVASSPHLARQSGFLLGQFEVDDDYAHSTPFKHYEGINQRLAEYDEHIKEAKQRVKEATTDEEREAANDDLRYWKEQKRVELPEARRMEREITAENKNKEKEIGKQLKSFVAEKLQAISDGDFSGYRTIDSDPDAWDLEEDKPIQSNDPHQYYLHADNIVKEYFGQKADLEKLASENPKVARAFNKFANEFTEWAKTYDDFDDLNRDGMAFGEIPEQPWPNNVQTALEDFDSAVHDAAADQGLAKRGYRVPPLTEEEQEQRLKEFRERFSQDETPVLNETQTPEPESAPETEDAPVMEETSEEVSEESPQEETLNKIVDDVFAATRPDAVTSHDIVHLRDAEIQNLFDSMPPDEQKEFIRKTGERAKAELEKALETAPDSLKTLIKGRIDGIKHELFVLDSRWNDSMHRRFMSGDIGNYIGYIADARRFANMKANNLRPNSELTTEPPEAEDRIMAFNPKTKTFERSIFNDDAPVIDDSVEFEEEEPEQPEVADIITGEKAEDFTKEEADAAKKDYDDYLSAPMSDEDREAMRKRLAESLGKKRPENSLHRYLERYADNVDDEDAANVLREVIEERFGKGEEQSREINPETGEIIEEQQDAPIVEEPKEPEEAMNNNSTEQQDDEYFAYEPLKPRDDEQIQRLQDQIENVYKKGYSYTGKPDAEREDAEARIKELMKNNDIAYRERAFNRRLTFQPRYKNGERVGTVYDGRHEKIGEYITEMAKSLGGDEFVSSVLHDPLIIKKADEIGGEFYNQENWEETAPGSGRYTYKGKKITGKSQRNELLKTLADRYEQWKDDPTCAILGKPLTTKKREKITSISPSGDKELDGYIDRFIEWEDTREDRTKNPYVFFNDEFDSLPVEKQEDLVRRAFRYAIKANDQALQLSPNNKEIFDNIEKIAGTKRRVDELDKNKYDWQRGGNAPFFTWFIARIRDAKKAEASARGNAPIVEESQNETPAPEPKKESKRAPKNVIPKGEAETIDTKFIQVFKDVTPNGDDDASGAWRVALEMTPGDKADKEAFKKEAENDPVIQQAFLELMESPTVKKRMGTGLLDEVKEVKSKEAWQKYHDVFNRRFYQWLYDDRNCIKKRKRLPEEKKPKSRYSRSSDDAPVLVF